MKLYVESLGTFYEMAREGASVAAGRLTRMTGIEARVGVTRLDFTDRSTLRSAFGTDRSRVGIRVDLERGLPGTSVILFGEETATEIVEKLLGDVQRLEQKELGRSAIVEVAQVMNNGFVDGWADVLQTEIDVSAPEYVSDTAAENVLGSTTIDATHDDLTLVFRNVIEAAGTELDFHHYVVPEHDAMASLLSRQADGTGIEHRKLAAFDRMAQRGASRMADSLSQSAGLNFEVDFRRINFLSLDAIPDAVAKERHVSVAFSYDGVLNGYLLFLFDEPSARVLVEAAVDEQVSAFDGIGRDAVKELSNMMASGLLDG